MQPLINACVFLFNFVISTYLYLLILRLLMQKFRVSWYNPLSQLTIKFTDPVIMPFRRYVPSIGGFDGVIIFWLIALQYLVLLSMFLVSGLEALSWMGIFILSVGFSVQKILNVYLVLIVAVAIMSWFLDVRSHPVGTVFQAIVEPGLRLIQKRVPAMSGFDLSPIIMLVGIQIIKILIITPWLAWGASMHAY